MVHLGDVPLVASLLWCPRAHEGRKKEAMSAQEENKAISRRVAEEIFNGGNLDLAEELYTPDYVLHDPSPRTCTVPRA